MSFSEWLGRALGRKPGCPDAKAETSNHRLQVRQTEIATQQNRIIRKTNAQRTELRRLQSEIKRRNGN